MFQNLQTMNITDKDNLIPLTPQTFHILLALSAAQDNGFGIMKTIENDSQGVIRVAPGTLYPALKRLCHFGYIREIGQHSASGRHGVTRVYRITPTGQQVLFLELTRYAQTAELGKLRLQATTPDRVQ